MFGSPSEHQSRFLKHLGQDFGGFTGLSAIVVERAVRLDVERKLNHVVKLCFQRFFEFVSDIAGKIFPSTATEVFTIGIAGVGTDLYPELAAYQSGFERMLRRACMGSAADVRAGGKS
ncbi:MAG: hypothetical protein R2688_00950 [Fimbriimonadaceae bacterium]